MFFYLLDFYKGDTLDYKNVWLFLFVLGVNNKKD